MKEQRRGVEERGGEGRKEKQRETQTWIGESWGEGVTTSLSVSIHIEMRSTVNTLFTGLILKMSGPICSLSFPLISSSSSSLPLSLLLLRLNSFLLPLQFQRWTVGILSRCISALGDKEVVSTQQFRSQLRHLSIGVEGHWSNTPLPAWGGCMAKIFTTGFTPQVSTCNSDLLLISDFLF